LSLGLNLDLHDTVDELVRKGWDLGSGQLKGRVEFSVYLVTSPTRPL